MVTNCFQFNLLSSARINCLSTPVLKQAPDRWCMAILVAGFGDLDMGMAVTKLIMMSMLMHKTVECISSDTTQIPGSYSWLDKNGLEPVYTDGVAV